MKKLQKELNELIENFNEIHLKVGKGHRYWETIQKAEKQFESQEQAEIRNFIFRNWESSESSEESWKTTSETEELPLETADQNEKNDQVSETKDAEEETKKELSGESVSPASYLLKKSRHSQFCFLELIHQENRIFFDVQKPWTLYWSLNSLAAMGQLNRVSRNDQQAISQHIMGFENHRTGSFAGGTGYQSNIISTYAAILSLALLDCPEVYQSVDRKQMSSFFSKMKVVIKPDIVLGPRLPKKLKKSEFLSSFKLTENGEFDIRNIYTSLVICSLMDVENQDQIFRGCVEFILACQSYEGGIGPRPGHEAHGGFTYCGVAALALLGRLGDLDLDRLLRWLCNRQMFYEGGFSGRTNKIVDSCYSFWQGASFSVLYKYRDQLGPKFDKIGLLFSPGDLQKYLLLACQLENGGFQDKPSKGRDMYHTMYSIIGLGLSVNLLQQLDCGNRLKEDWPEGAFEVIDPVFTIPKSKVKKIVEFWSTQ